MNKYCMRRPNTSISTKRNNSLSTHHLSICQSNKRFISALHRQTLPLPKQSHLLSKQNILSNTSNSFLNKNIPINPKKFKSKQNLQNNIKINKNSISQSFKKISTKLKQQIQSNFLNQMNTIDTIHNNLQVLKKSLYKIKSNKVVGKLITDVSDKYEKIIQSSLNLYRNSLNFDQSKKKKSQNTRKLKLHLADIKTKDIKDYQDEFMSNFNAFSQSWRDLIQKEKKF